MNFGNQQTTVLQNTIRKYFMEMIGPDGYQTHEKIIEDLADDIRNEKDYLKLGQLIAEIYQAGWSKAIESQKAELSKMGLKATVKVVPNEPKNPIFK